MAVVCLPASIGTTGFATPTFGHINIGTPTFGASHVGTPTFEHPHMRTSMAVPTHGGHSNAGTPTFGLATPILGHTPSNIQHVVQPVICAQPAYRGPVLHSILANKPRSPPDSAGSGTNHDTQEDAEKCSTPYRLPRISPWGTPCPEESPLPLEAEQDKVWGRFGYEENVRMPELGPSIHKALTNYSPSPAGPGVSVSTPVTPGVGPRTVVAAQRYRQNAMLVPKFRSAAIIPSATPSIPRDVEDHDIRVFKSMLEKVGSSQQRLPHPSVSTPGDSRSMSPAKSTKSIHWALGSHRHPLFDYKGRSRKQGPYSREFTVHCTPPASWMRMKWGRQRAPVH